MATEWKKVKLQEICESISDGDHLPPPKAEKGIPFVTISNIKDNQLDFTDTMFVPETYYEKLDNKRKAKTGDILYSVVGSFGIPVLLKRDEKFVFQRHIAILRPNKIESSFLYYTMLGRDFYAKADAAAIGAAQRTVSLTSLRNIEICLPPLETQQKIAGILSAYDDLIENNHKQIKLLEEAAQKLYKEWFVKLNFPGHENEKIVDGVPEGWSFERIDSFIELLNGFAFKSDSFDNEGKYKIITIKNVQDGAFDSFNVNRVKDVPSKMPDWCNLEIGDILLSLTGNVGRVCLVTSENCLLNQRVAKLKSEYPAYTYTLFRSKDMFVMMNNLANGAAQQNLSPIRTGEQKILKPTNEIISAFEKLVSPYIKKELSLFIQIQLLQSARDKLLPKLMNGEVEV